MEDVEKRLSRGQALKLATTVLQNMASIAPEKSDKLLTKADYEEAVSHLKFINQFYL
jgi:hypothetical protein